MTVEKTQPVMVDDFDNFIARPENHDRLFELIDGEIVEKIPTEEHGEVTLILGGELRSWVVPRKLGRVVVEARHRLPGDQTNSRLPDVSFIAGKRPRVTDGNVPQMPDLAIEVKSPDDSLPKMRAKAQYYLANGTRLVWIVDPAKRYVIVLTPDDEQIMLEHETLTGGDVLPGFTLAVKTIFADPLTDE